MIIHTPRPQTMHERLLLVAPACGGMPAAGELTEEELLVLEAHVTHQQESAALQNQLSALLANMPPRPDSGGKTSADVGRAYREWLEAVRDTQWLIVQCDRCFHDPLDSEFGEQEKPRPLAHWGQPKCLNAGGDA